MQPTASATTHACGINGELACKTGAACNGTDLVVDGSGKCVACGHDNLPTCDNGRCDVGFVGHNGFCPPCGRVNQWACAAEDPCVDHAWPNPNGVCEIACGQSGQDCCETGKECDPGLTCDKGFFGLSRGTCKGQPDPQEDPNCGVLSAPPHACCHTKTPCQSNAIKRGVCDSYGYCQPVPVNGASSAVCNGNNPVSVTVCVTTEWASQTYPGNWCSEDDAKQSYEAYCQQLKTEHGYSQCDVAIGNCP
jgi:hypothetical protein